VIRGRSHHRGVTEHDGHPTVTLRLEGDAVEILPPVVAAARAPAAAD